MKKRTKSRRLQSPQDPRLLKLNARATLLDKAKKDNGGQWTPATFFQHCKVTRGLNILNGRKSNG